MRFSVRTLLIAVFFCSVAFAALKFAGPVWWTVLSGLSLLAFLAIAVIAFVGRDAMQASAIGFLVCVVVYGSLLAFSRSDEFDPYVGSMPTSRLMRPLFQSLVETTWIDIQTREEVPNYDPTATSAQFGWPSVGITQYPDRFDFMAIGHLLWAMLLGLMGGLFGRFVFAQRTRRSS